MTTEQFEQQFQADAPAVHYLSDAVADFLLNRGHAAKIGEIALDRVPRWDGLATDGQRLYIATEDGRVMCLAR